MCYIKSHCCFLFHTNEMIFKLGIKLLLVFSHSCNPHINVKYISHAIVNTSKTHYWVDYMNGKTLERI